MMTEMMTVTTPFAPPPPGGRLHGRHGACRHVFRRGQLLVHGRRCRFVFIGGQMGRLFVGGCRLLVQLFRFR